MSWFDSTGRQIYTTLCSNLLSVAYGTSIGWASDGLPVLQSNQTVLPSGPLTKEDSSWIQSSFTIGGFFGSLLFGWVSDQIGRKKSLLVIALPQIVSWITLIFAQNWIHVLLSRCLAGLAGGGLYCVIPLFISEISDDRIRGRLGSVFVFASGTGILLGYLCGTVFTYSKLPFLYMPITLLFVVGSFFYPESAFYLVKIKKYNEAQNSIQFFRGSHARNEQECQISSQEQVKIEFESIKSLINDGDREGRIEFKNFATKPALKVLTIGILLMFLEQFSGVFALLFFVSTIFDYSGSTFSSQQSSIIVGIIQLAGAYFSTLLVDKLGRRSLICVSALSISIGLCTFAASSFFISHGNTWSHLKLIPLLSFSFVLFTANLGVLTLPFLVMSELMITLPNIKSFVYTFCLCLSWVFAGFILKYSESMIELLTISGLMLIFSINSLMGGLFVLWYVPETKGKSFQEILKSLGYVDVSDM